MGNELRGILTDAKILQFILIFLGLLTYSSTEAKKWIHLDYAKIAIPPLIFSLFILIFEYIFNIVPHSPNSLLVSIIINPIIEELIFRQPLFFLRKTKFYWPIGLILGIIFILMHDSAGIFELIVRIIGTLLLLISFRKYGLAGSILTHSILNMGSLIKAFLV
ncbi:CPBP family glutamic-type intramembrane protease [Deinococcus sp. UR1]|uniref:CPBP family glutamic-type intramembrane protease n=1 Tax=Deinococcus sp. UR1 TaxID=1704277 RepID=UPI00130455BC